jgi:hypothetical protein
VIGGNAKVREKATAELAHSLKNQTQLLTHVIECIVPQNYRWEKSMQCNVCGLEYGMSHNCPGPITGSVLETLDAALKPPTDGGMGYYLGEAWKIVRWDDVAIRRNAKDGRAMMYAVPIWLAAMVVVLLGTTLPGLIKIMSRVRNPQMAVLGAIVGLGFGLIVMAVLTFVQLGLCHAIAKWLFGATGRYIEVMRPLLLGWFVNCSIVIPGIGMLLAGIGWTAVLMMVFEEVDGIGRLQAFGISVGINICFFILQFWLMPGRGMAIR